jgi:hypothetical protein
MFKQAIVLSVVREASFVSRCRPGCRILARVGSLFTGVENAASVLALPSC